jgi:glutaminyl-tRNA synthetase
MCVLRPLKLVIENYPEGQVEELDGPFYPHDVPKEGSRRVPFSRILYIEKDDFAENPPKGFHRLSPGREVRLRYAYLVRCESVVKDATGEIVEVRCTYDPATRGGAAPDGRKVPGTLHWVSADQSIPVEVRLYDRLFKVERPDLEEGGFETTLNPSSLEVLKESRLEPAAVDPSLGDRLQFERQGYFFRDPVESRPDHLVFNRIVPLRDSWAQEAQKPAAAPKPPEPKKAPKEIEAKAPEPLTPEEQEQLDRLRSDLQPIIQGVLAAHPTEVERYRAGKTGILGFLVAQVMKQAGPIGKANPKLVNILLTRELKP